ncbi:MAG: galactokinase [Phycisphaeraceae bacterium]|nr:galactokinase [Phycisphaerales bacterium]MCB9860963.1 galactokinase [Phycisphaeraceae bacterium]
MSVNNRQSGSYLSKVRDASSLFAGAFGDPPAAAAVAPGRVNIIGDHIDYCGGTVLPMAINRWTAVVGSLRDDGMIRWAQQPDDDAERDEDGKVIVPIETHAQDEPRPEPGLSMSYIAGTVQTVLDEIGQSGKGLDVVLASNVPIGAGLSSSATLCASVAMCVLKLTGAELDPQRVAKLCQRVEHEWASVPCGIMDQYAVVLSQAGHATMIDCARDDVSHVPVPDDIGWLILDTGTRRSLADSAYADRRDVCARAAEKFGVEYLCHASLDDVNDPYARHVISEHHRVRAVVDAIQARDMKIVGQCMIESHASLRDDYKVSSPALDRAVQALCAMDSVRGARMTGAGFGGCVIAAVQKDSMEVVIAKVRDRVLHTISPRATVFAVHPVDCARSL